MEHTVIHNCTMNTIWDYVSVIVLCSFAIIGFLTLMDELLKYNERKKKKTDSKGNGV